jgi:16S rRNA (adenine1518-N6/adenine1519-N6)-dimethyltransferase
MGAYIKPLKSLGQHFLSVPAIAKQIACSLSGDGSYSQVLEIGPGTGVLTEALLENGVENLFCIEIDNRSVDILNTRFPELKNRIIHGDFLASGLEFMGDSSFAVIGNFPYNISSQILFKILDFYHRVPEVTGMFQKEVAQRIASPPGNKNYGILSVLLQAHYDIDYLFTVPPEAFLPPPKVESGVIHMKLKQSHQLECDPVKFKLLVKTAFNQRRKTLRNSIKSLLPANISAIPYLTLRPEQLHHSQFAELTRMIWH